MTNSKRRLLFKKTLLIKILGEKNIDHILNALASGFDMQALEMGRVHHDEIAAGMKLANIMKNDAAKKYRQIVTDPDGIISQRTDK